jgi:hypothetical protein
LRALRAPRHGAAAGREHGDTMGYVMHNLAAVPS